METLKFSRAQMEKRVARFSDLEAAGDVAGKTGAMPADLRATVMSQTVCGLISPSGGGDRNFWDSAALPAGTSNFGAVIVRCNQGEGAGWHVHRYSYECFMALQGKWRVFWNEPEQEEHLDIVPFDLVSIPPGAVRRFEYLGEGRGALLAFAYAGEHSIADSDEIWVPPCEIERIDSAVGGKGGAYDEYVRSMRESSERVSGAVTEDDREFTRKVAETTGAL